MNVPLEVRTLDLSLHVNTDNISNHLRVWTYDIRIQIIYDNRRISIIRLR